MDFFLHEDGAMMTSLLLRWTDEAEYESIGMYSNQTGSSKDTRRPSRLSTLSIVSGLLALVLLLTLRPDDKVSLRYAVTRQKAPKNRAGGGDARASARRPGDDAASAPPLPQSVDSHQHAKNVNSHAILPLSRTGSAKIPAKAARTTKGRIKSIHLIGERHSGTNWITGHLQACFGAKLPVLNRYTRFKHWFQYNDTIDDAGTEHYHPPGSALVVSIFRSPVDWVNAMRERPYHSPMHFHLGWKEFVTRPWTIERGEHDRLLIESGAHVNATCERPNGMSFDEVVPCSAGDRKMGNYTFNGRSPIASVLYEHDSKTGRPYGSVVDLRRDKIRNFLGLAGSPGVGAFVPVRYERLVRRGTGDLIGRVENETGVTAECDRFPARKLARKAMDPGFVEWMNEHVDWETEKLIGYKKRD